MVPCRRTLCDPWLPLGAALLAYHCGRRDATVVVESDIFATESFPAEAFYRPEPVELPAIELQALSRCRGRVLDLGAGAGRHALELQRLGREVVALDVSPEAVTVMGERGVRDARLGRITDIVESFDTVLMLMNGIGIAGSHHGLERLLAAIRSRLRPGGLIICDSADLSTGIDRATLSRLKDDAFGKPEHGEVFFRLQFEDLIGDWYPWLFAPAAALAKHASNAGFDCETVAHGERGSFLACLRAR